MKPYEFMTFYHPLLGFFDSITKPIKNVASKVFKPITKKKPYKLDKNNLVKNL